MEKPDFEAAEASFKRLEELDRPLRSRPASEWLTDEERATLKAAYLEAYGTLAGKEPSERTALLIRSGGSLSMMLELSLHQEDLLQRVIGNHFLIVEKMRKEGRLPPAAWRGEGTP